VAVAGLLLLGLLTSAAVQSVPSPVSQSGQRPNVVFVVTDDQRQGTLRYMPNVRSLLVREGTTFPHAMVPTALCCPARASLLTGLYAHNTSVYGNGGDAYGGYQQFHRRGLDYRTIAIALQQRGYRTGMFGKFLNNVGTTTPFGFTPPGWDVFMRFAPSKGKYFGYQLSDGSYHGRTPRDYSTDVLARKANRFIRDTPRRQPVFIWLAPFAPHKPYTPAPRHVGATETLAPPDAVSRTWTGRPGWKVRRERGDLAAGAVQQRQVATLLAVDDAVGSVMRMLQRTGRAGDTLFVFTSDNGYLWGEHGLVGKDVPYDAATRVPLVMRWDGHLPAGTVDNRLALNIDLATTVSRVAAAGMETDGLDLFGGERRRGFVLEAMSGYAQRPAYCGWRTKHRMYVKWADGRTELYDYRSDPFEADNLAGQVAHREVERRMRQKAAQHCDPTPPGFSW
jgi:arylsulfatase A-like enzyme